MPISRYSLLIIIITFTLSACSQSSSSSGKHSSLSHSSSSQSYSKKSSPSYKAKGKASFYADRYQGRQTASGERFNQRANTAAHRKLPFGTWVKVTNVNTGKSVTVRINDRGPFVRGRIIDLSKSAFNAIASTRLGVVNVIIDVIR